MFMNIALMFMKVAPMFMNIALRFMDCPPCHDIARHVDCSCHHVD
jgi:hypothetical protein